MSKNIFILSERRTGSNYLCDTFTYYDNVRVMNELFNRLNKVEKFDDVYDNEHEMLYKFFKVSTFDSLVNAFLSNPQKSLTFLSGIIPCYKLIKIQDDQLKEFKLNFIFDEEDSFFIVLKRQQKIYQYVSDIISEKTKQWHSVDTSDVTITVDRRNFELWLERSNNYYNEITSILRDRNIDFLSLTYENDIGHNVDRLLEKIETWAVNNDLKLIRKANNDGYISVIKQNKRDILNIVKNYKEIEDLVV